MVILMDSVTPANAQDGKSPYFRRFEIGWDVLSYWREGNNDLVGANFSFAVRKSDRLAFVAEYAAHSRVFAEDIISSYHFGPRYYAKPRGRLQPFIEILAGGTHLNQSPSGSSAQDS